MCNTVPSSVTEVYVHKLHVPECIPMLLSIHWRHLATRCQYILDSVSLAGNKYCTVVKCLHPLPSWYSSVPMISTALTSLSQKTFMKFGLVMNLMGLLKIWPNLLHPKYTYSNSNICLNGTLPFSTQLVAFDSNPQASGSCLGEFLTTPQVRTLGRPSKKLNSSLIYSFQQTSVKR